MEQYSFAELYLGQGQDTEPRPEPTRPSEAGPVVEEQPPPPRQERPNPRVVPQQPDRTSGGMPDEASGATDIQSVSQAYRPYLDSGAGQPRPARQAESMSFAELYDIKPPEKPAASKRPAWAIPGVTGTVAAYEGGENALSMLGDMKRIYALPKEQQTQALLDLPQFHPTVQPEVPYWTDVNSAGTFFTYVADMGGQMIGSMVSAVKSGGLPAAATLAPIGGAVGATGAGIGAIPGAVAAGGAGLTGGTAMAMGGMGVGGTMADLLADEGVRAALKAGTLTPEQLLYWSLGAGAAIGLLDTIVPKAMVDQVLGTGIKNMTIDQVKALAKKSISRAAIGAALKQSPKEMGTEGLQGFISEAAQAYLGGNLNLGERSVEVVNQALGGLLGAPLPSAASGAFGHPRVRRAADAAIGAPSDPSLIEPAPPLVPPSTPGGAGVSPNQQAGTQGPNLGNANQPHGAAGGTGQPPPQPNAAGVRKPAKDYTKGRKGGGARVASTGAVDADTGAALKGTVVEEDAPADVTYEQGEGVSGSILDAIRRNQQAPRTPAGAQPARAENAESQPAESIDAAMARGRARGKKGLEEVVDSAIARRKKEMADAGIAPLQPKPDATIIVNDPAVEAALAARSSAAAVTPQQQQVGQEQAGAGMPAAPAPLSTTPQQQFENPLPSNMPTNVGPASQLPATPASYDEYVASQQAPQAPAAAAVPPAQVMPAAAAPQPAINPQLSAELAPAAAQVAELPPTPAPAPEPPKRARLRLSPEQRRRQDFLERVQNFAEALDPADVTDRSEAVRRLRELADDLEAYELFYSALPKELSDRLPDRPENLAPAPERQPQPQAQPERGYHRFPEAPTPAAPEARPQARPAEWKEKAKARVTKVTARLTPALWQNMVNNMGRAAALARLAGSAARHKSGKKATIHGHVMEGERPPAPEREAGPTITIAGKTYHSTAEVEAALAQAKKGRKKQLARALSDAMRGPEYGALLRYEKNVPEQPRGEAYPEGRLVVQVGRETRHIPVEELLSDYVVDLKTKQESIETEIPERVDIPRERGAASPPPTSIAASEEGRAPAKPSVVFEEVKPKAWYAARIAARKAKEAVKNVWKRPPVRKLGKDVLDRDLQPTEQGKPVAAYGRIATGTPVIPFQEPRGQKALPFKGKRTPRDVPLREDIIHAVAKERGMGGAEAERGGRDEEAAGNLTSNWRMVGGGETATRAATEAELIKVAMRSGMSEKDAQEQARLLTSQSAREDAARIADEAKAAAEERKALEKAATEAARLAVGKRPKAAPYEIAAAAFEKARDRVIAILEKFDATQRAKLAAAIAEDERAQIEATRVYVEEKQKEERTAGKTKSWRAMEGVSTKDLRDEAMRQERKLEKERERLNDSIARLDKNIAELEKMPQSVGKTRTTLNDARLLRDQLKQEQDELEASVDPFLQQIAVYNQEIIDLGRKKETLNARTAKEGLIQFVNKQRVAHYKSLQQKADAAKKRAFEAEIKQKNKLRDVLEKAVARGELTAEEAGKVLERDTVAGSYAAMKKRTRKTGPVLRQLFTEMLPQMPFQDESQNVLRRDPGKIQGVKSRRKGKTKAQAAAAQEARTATDPARVNDPRKFIHVIADFFKQFVAEGNRRLEAAGATMPEKLAEYTNSPEENVFRFIQRYGTGRAVKGRTWHVNAETIHESYAAYLYLLNYLKKRTPIDRHFAIEDLNATLFDALRTDEGSKAAAKLEAAQARRARRTSAQEEVPHEQGEASDTYGELQSPVDLGMPGPGSPIGKPTWSGSGREAIDRYLKGWQYKSFAPQGWNRVLRRALLGTFKALAGDIEVHVVDAVYTNGKAGIYQAPTKGGKARILINDAALKRPKVLTETLVHEFIHASTYAALRANLRGTADIVDALIGSLKKTLGEDIPEALRYALKNAHEFVAQGMGDQRVQDILASLNAPAELRARVRALGAGRAMPSYWDMFMGMVENAIGFFTPGRPSSSYLDQLVRLYPHVAQTQAEQRQTLTENDLLDAGNDALESPLDGNAVTRLAKSMLQLRQGAGRFGLGLLRSKHKFVTSSEDLHRLNADEHWGGNMKNPLGDNIDLLLSHPRAIEEEMRVGDEMDDAINRAVREQSRKNVPLMDKMHGILTEAQTATADPFIPLDQNKHIRDDANHPLKGRRRTKPTFKHLADAFKRAAHGRLKAALDALPLAQDLKDRVHARLKHMSDKIDKYHNKMITRWLEMLQDKGTHQLVLPTGIDMDEAVRQVSTGKISDELKAALGENYAEVREMSRWAAVKGLYLPFYRNGDYFITARRKIAMPAATHGQVMFDKHTYDQRGVYQFIFSDARDFVAYQEKIGQTGEERIIGTTHRWVDPLTGKFVPKEEITAKNGQLYYAQPVFFVTVQDRHMLMSDNVDELNEMRDAMKASGEYEHVSDDPILLEDVRNPRKVQTGIPVVLESMLNKVDGMKGIDAHEKALFKRMFLNSYIQSQGGTRLTKHMLKRRNVHGSEVGYAEMMQSLRTNNEMLSRAIVAIDRLPRISRNNRYLQDYLDVAQDRSRTDALARLTPRDRTHMQTEYGKSPNQATRLSADIAEVNRRLGLEVDGGNKPFSGQKYVNALLSSVTQAYLATPSYFALQMLSLGMQTFPRMVKNMLTADKNISSLGGVARASRYLTRGLRDVGVADVTMKGVSEVFREAAQFAKGFVPRQGFFEHGRAPRKRADLMQTLYSRIMKGPSKYAADLVDVMKHAYKLGFIGQSGIFQQNLRMDTFEGGLRNKLLRGIESSAAVFRAMLEPIEIMNRAAPIAAYYNYYRDAGMSHEEAKARSISNMVSEQTGYAKENWGTIMSHPAVEVLAQFKKFGLTQLVSFWGSVKEVISGENRRAALMHLATMSLVLMAVGGLAGNPLLEPIRYLLYFFQLFGDGSTSWANQKTRAQQALGEKIGTGPAEALMYGLPRTGGLDLSGRVALDSTAFFSQPDEMTKEEWYKVLGQSAGPTPTAIMDMFGAIKGMTDDNTSTAKWISQLPVPKMVKDILKTYDNYTYGPQTSSGIQTGPPPGLLEAMVQAMGFRTASQARPFELGSAAQYRLKQEAGSERAAILEGFARRGMTGENMRKLRDFNRRNPEQRITNRTITQSRKHRTQTKRDIMRENVEAYQ